MDLASHIYGLSNPCIWTWQLKYMDLATHTVYMDLATHIYGLGNSYIWTWLLHFSLMSISLLSNFSLK